MSEIADAPQLGDRAMSPLINLAIVLQQIAADEAGEPEEQSGAVPDEQ